MADPDIESIERRMHGAIDSLKRDFGGLRTGRAQASLLEPITVEAYGARMPLNQVGTITVPESRMINVQVWDRGLAAATEKAIRDGGLGLNPMREGQTIRVPIPELSGERRKELAKIANRYAEQARVAVRNVRRDGMDMLKKMEKAGELSEDEQKLWGDEIQGMTDKAIAEIDSALTAKDAEIMQV